MSRSSVCAFLALSLIGFLMAAPAKVDETKDRGTIKGRVVLVGDKPDVDKLNKELAAIIEGHKDKDGCLACKDPEEKSQQVWKIDKDGGVANVFVWLKPANGDHFKLTEADLKPFKDSQVTLRQPHCAYLPHAFTLFPSYFDDKTKRQKPTGQKLLVKNDAKFVHNTKWSGVGQRGDDKLIAPGREITVEPTLKPTASEISFGCSAHVWMTAVARAFDHPFATVTDANGNFVIKNVPLGVELYVVAWHEKAGYAVEGGKDGVKMKLTDGERVSFTIKKP
jgi:hypothetical protein